MMDCTDPADHEALRRCPPVATLLGLMALSDGGNASAVAPAPEALVDRLFAILRPPVLFVRFAPPSPARAWETLRTDSSRGFAVGPEFLEVLRTAAQQLVAEDEPASPVSLPGFDDLRFVATHIVDAAGSGVLMLGAGPDHVLDDAAPLVLRAAAAQLTNLLERVEPTETRSADQDGPDGSRLRRIVDAIPGLVAVLGPTGDIQFVNEQTLEYLGMPLEELRHWDTNAAVHPDDLRHVMPTLTRALAAGEPHEYEVRLRRSDGAYRWFQHRGVPERGDRGEIIRWHVLLTDIEDLKLAQEALRAAEDALLQTIDAIPVMAWSAHPDGRATFFNKRSLDLLGMRAEEAGGWGWAAALHPEDAEDLLATWQRIVGSGRSGEAEARLRVQEHGDYRRFLFRANPLLDEAGTVVQWYGVNVDIEDRTRAEAAVKRAYDHLAEAQRLSNTGSFTANPERDAYVWSEQFYRICEIEPGTTMTLRELEAMTVPGDIPSVTAALQASMAAREAEFRCRIVTPRGNLKYLRGVVRRLEQIDKGPMIVGAVQDVTATRKAEETLSQVRSELAHVARITALSTMTASITHEVIQPLSGIITNAITCARALTANPPNIGLAREATRRLLRDGDRAVGVVTRLRAMFSKGEFTLERMDLNEAAREVVALSSADLQRNGVVVEPVFGEDLPPVAGDRIQLQQVILNLIRNASDAMSEVRDRPRRLVISTARAAAGHVSLSVSDAGVGLDPQTNEKLFDAFYTTKKGGMGIGLSVSRSIIERHGGSLWAQPNDGPGASFTFSIPAARGGGS
jgi:PAS domain S-box-containing protein